MFDIGRSRIYVAHAFVKADMYGILDTAGFEVEPNDIFRGVRGVTEEDASFSMEGELGGAFTRRTDPDAATKSAEIGEIILVFGTS